MRHMRLLLQFFLLLPLVLPAVAAAAFVEFSPERTVFANVTATEWRNTSQDQTIGLHRYRQTSDEPPTAVVFYLPGTNMNGTLKTTTPDYNLWLFLASRGIEVYALDYRTRFVSADHPGDLAFMRDWTMSAFVDDAAKAAQFIRVLAPDAALFVAGFSRGVSYAYALAGRIDLRGLIAIDGSFKQPDPEPFDLAAALNEFDREARWASAVSRRGEQARTKMMQEVIDDPGAPATDARYESAGEQLAGVLHNAWGPGALANTQDGISDVQILAREMISYDWFFPRIQNLEGQALRSQKNDPTQTLDDHFGEITAPVLYMGGTGMGAGSLLAGIYSADAAGPGDATIHVLEGYGHLDMLFAEQAERSVYTVIYEWIIEQAN